MVRRLQGFDRADADIAYTHSSLNYLIVCRDINLSMDVIEDGINHRITRLCNLL